MKKIGFLVFALIVTRAVAPAQQGVTVRNGPASHSSLSSLLSEADAIVVGTLRSTSQAGLRVSLDLHVERTIQGPLAVQDEIFVAFDTDSRAFFDPGSITALWFLKGNAANWSALPVVVSSMPSLRDFYLVVPLRAPAAQYQVPDTADPSEKVIGEIAAANLTSFDWPWVLGLAKELPNSASLRLMYRSLADSPSDSTSGSLGIAGLILLGESEGFTRLAGSNLIGPQSSPATDVVAMAVCESPRDTAPIDILGNLLSASAPRLARCAGQVLRGVHTRATLPYLAGLLDNSSSDLRYEGVVGLASFANNLAVHHGQSSTASMEWLSPLPGTAPYATSETLQNLPTLQTFREKEAQYIGFWKAWWAQNQTSLK